MAKHVRGDAHTNGIESLWSMFKRSYTGTYHKMSRAHLHRYVNEFTGRHNIRPLNTGSRRTRPDRSIWTRAFTDPPRRHQ